MSNYVFTTYGGYDSLSTALTMMQLIFANVEYKGWFAGIAIFGMIISFYTHLVSGRIGSGINFLPWLVKPIIGITIFMAFIQTQANLQIIDYTTSQTSGFNVPIGMAFIMSNLNQLECSLVNVISDSGPVDQPANYRKFAGGSGYDLFENISKHRNVQMEHTLNNYMKDCVVMVAAFTGFANFDLRQFQYGDTTAGTGFFDMLSTGQSVLLSTIDETQVPVVESSCSLVWTGTLYPYYSNPASFISDANQLCSDHGYDPTNASSLAECHSKMEIILKSMTNKPMAMESYLQMKNASEIAMSNLNSSDADGVAVKQAEKTLLSQGMGISAVFSKLSPIVRNIMWSIVIVLIPLCSLFILTPLFANAITFIFGLMVLLSTWTVIDCGVHVAMQSYVASKFANLASMGNGIMYYANMPSAASDAIGIYGMLKGSTLMLAAAACAGLFKLASSHAITQFAGGVQSSLDSAGRQAGTTAYTSEGRAQAIEQQHQATKTMDNAHRWTPEQMTNKGSIEAQASMGNAMKIQRGFEESVSKGFSTRAGGIAGFESEKGFQETQGQLGGLLGKQNVLKAAIANKTLGEGANLTDLAQNQAQTNQSLSGNNGTTTMSVGNVGNVLQSDNKSGFTAKHGSTNAEKPTEIFEKGSGGAFDLKFNDTIEAQTSKAIDTADSRTATAQTAKAQNLSTSRANAKSFNDTVQASKSYSDSERKSVQDSYTRAFTVSDDDAERLHQSSGLSVTDSHTLLSAVQSELGVGVPMEAVTGVSAGLKKSGSTTDTANIAKAVSAIKSGDYSHMEHDSRDWRSAVTAGTDKTHNKTNSSVKSGSDNLTATWAKNDSLTKSVTDAQTHADTVRSTASEMKKQSLSTSEDGFLPTFNQLVKNNGGGEKGTDAATKIFTDYNNGTAVESSTARAKILEARDQAGVAFGQELNNKVAGIEKDAKDMSAGVEKDIAGTRAELPQTPQDLKTINSADNKEVDAERKKNDVQAGKVIKGVAPVIKAEDRHAQDVKIPKPVMKNKPAVEAMHKSMSTDLHRKQNQLLFTRELASTQLVAGFTGIAEKTEDFSGMALETIKDVVTHPLDTAEGMKQQAQGYLRKKK